MNPFKNVSGDKETTGKLISVEKLERLEKDPRASADLFVYRLLYKKDV